MSKTSSRPNLEPFTIDHLQGAFYILAIGLVASVVSMTVECMVGRRWTSINVSCQSKRVGWSFLHRGFVHIKLSIAQLGEWAWSLLRGGFVHIKSSIAQCRALPYPTL